ncbi:S8 family peptidase [Crocinitomix catalasitica]|uniref:S8 family peptidase n=1 Tax=Crocinitomix catalasitica TaxID=184607 RepID=UPI0005628CC9|nr:S8 family peptidase [Crocinitomix catalasitica]
MNKFGKIAVATLLLASQTVGAQENVDKKILNWYNGAKFGMSTDKAYAKLLSAKESKPVVVAVIDSGVDIEHVDLKGKIWVNTDEIAGNGIDDDNNGYIDDVHGWNFLGNADGENMNSEQLEVTRLYVSLSKKFDGVNESDVKPTDKSDYELYKVVKAEYEGAVTNAQQTLGRVEQIIAKVGETRTSIETKLGKKDFTVKDLEGLKKSDPSTAADVEFMTMALENGWSKESLQGAVDHFTNQLNTHYNAEVAGRTIIGDNPNDFTDVNYGNNDVEGPDAFHGTHVAGIIGAVRNNGIGNDGVADNILIMSVRAVPDGDEADKDVALAIRYAVDNGAQVVNMSFGKSYSPYQEEVANAIKYAEDKGVLLVHAAGNSSKDIGVEPNYPTPQYSFMNEKFTNWIEVGASTKYKKSKLSKDGPFLVRPGLAASFSNYNKTKVDVFAPGLEIYATTPNDEYAAIQGTSMAAPMVAGVAALLKSYYPSLTMIEIKEIIFASVQEIDRTTPLPGEATNQVAFDTLSATGGIVNVYNAVKLAEEKIAK